MDTAQTVAKALGLLELLGKQSLTAAQIIDKTKIHRSTAYRLLGTLIQLGYLRKNDTNGLYSLSPKILTLASSVRETKDIKEIAQPHIDELHSRVHETIHLAVLDNDELVYLDKRESTRNLRVVMSSKTGSHAPLYCTGIGKVLLSGMSDAQLREYLRTVRFVKYTEHTLPGAPELLNEIDDIKKRGFAEDREEHEDGVYCVAAPVIDSDGSVIAAFSVSLPSVRATDSLKKSIIEDVQLISKRISGEIG
ncbi:MAG: IclR family transcriptional regulator [Spirochaetales bacterium]|uniref:IclR family transcriptional regulator n=1 Tax=Candidatus Thalassospirochaeta sargassi TaxID=3119039 RepID=A0AAJ1IDD6_9SPIO|nr:IclR family transcriptional regulator [Spirochaetales bacterium]